MSLCFNCLMILVVFFFVADYIRIRSAMVELTFVVVCWAFFSCFFVAFHLFIFFVFATSRFFYCSLCSTCHLRIQPARFEFACLFCVFSLCCCCAFVFLFVFHVLLFFRCVFAFVFVSDRLFND